MGVSVQEALMRKAASGFTGRRKELDALLASVAATGPVVQFVHGVAGIGKSALLDAFSGHATAHGINVVRLDCRLVEPTPEGFLRELGHALGRELTSAQAASAALAEVGGSASVVVLDSYELLRLLDTWIRQVFVPLLDERTRVVLGTRHAPAAPWTTSPEWQGLVRVLPLESLSGEEAVEMLQRAGFDPEHAEQVNRLAQGHPLALRLAVAARVHNPGARIELAADAVVHQLTRCYMTEVTDADTRTGIEAASTVRRTTVSLLRAMVSGTNPQELYDRLSSISFVQPTREGLMLHGRVQDTVSSWLQTSDPQRWGMYRRAAWRQLWKEAQSAGRTERWRYTADMLYMSQSPFVREAFFPSGSQDLVVEPARAGDRSSIAAIAEAHETKSASAALDRLWERCPECFHVARDGSGSVVGFYVLLEMRRAELRSGNTDPLVRCWRKHLREQPLGEDETALFLRCWRSATTGEGPGPVQAACWLDVKRAYLELRPRLRRCYLSVRDLTTYGPVAQQLGFRVAGRVDFDGVPHHLAVLDFGPDSVDGWLRDMVARELGVERPDLLDVDARELVVDGHRTPLTELEFALLRCLMESDGRVLARSELLKRVWGRSHSSGSNVVDVVVRSLRKKMGAHERLVETVRGVGYRFRG